MFFFFIGGIQPKRTVIENTPWTCPNCGLSSARFVRTDYYVSIFFFPLFPIKRGEPFYECSRCKETFSTTGHPVHREQRGAGRKCRICGKPLEQDFAYCPFCGHNVIGG